MANVHVDNLKKEEWVEVVGVVDLYLEKAHTLAKEADLKRGGRHGKGRSTSRP